MTVLALRQTGKSTTIGALAYDDVTRGKTCLLAAPSQRQSQELLRRIVVFLQADPVPPKLIRQAVRRTGATSGGAQAIKFVPPRPDRPAAPRGALFRHR